MTATNGTHLIYWPIFALPKISALCGTPKFLRSALEDRTAYIFSSSGDSCQFCCFTSKKCSECLLNLMNCTWWLVLLASGEGGREADSSFPCYSHIFLQLLLHQIVLPFDPMTPLASSQAPTWLLTHSTFIETGRRIGKTWRRKPVGQDKGREISYRLLSWVKQA